MQKVSIQHVLANVCEELFALSHRLQYIEKIIFDPDTKDVVTQDLQRMQDIDLIIQQIADLARAIDCIAEAQLGETAVAKDILDDRMHLGDLRKRLLGIAEDRLISASAASRDVLLF